MLFFRKSDSVSHIDQLSSICKDAFALVAAWQKSPEALYSQSIIRIPSILESIYMILRKKWGSSEKLLDTTGTKKQKAIRQALFLSISIILILVLHPPNIDLLLMSVFEKAYPILEVLIELFMKNSNKEPPCKGSKKRLRKDKRNRNK
ncbi:Uncharacterised protein [Streptococcus cristatus]|uniref:Uncharacterized protein n=2 Tax=Streptococcus cristatus TaxID=45634 RepID=A0A512AD24_STRCR|nr:hypothetical protein [Streptococcus cristatus]AGK71382.1 hypothetical protein I872_06480 [Streptococcus cristatus AS 1.3089]GEN97597.1 hypothetical protein SOL01_14710 [Streptococcus cristatus]SQI45706.1 Uncharacterised protein [Streptococcus cristatus]